MPKPDTEFSFLDFDGRSRTSGPPQPLKNTSPRASGGRRSTDRASDDDNSDMYMLGGAIVGAAIIGLGIVAGYIGMAVWG